VFTERNNGWKKLNLKVESASEQLLFCGRFSGDFLSLLVITSSGRCFEKMFSTSSSSTSVQGVSKAELTEAGVGNPNCWHQKIMEKHCNLGGEQKLSCKTIEKLLEKCPGKDVEVIQSKIVETEEDAEHSSSVYDAFPNSSSSGHGFGLSPGPGISIHEGFDRLEREMKESFGGLGGLFGSLFGGFDFEQHPHAHPSHPHAYSDSHDPEAFTFQFRFPRRSSSEQNPDTGGEEYAPRHAPDRAPHRQHADHRANMHTKSHG